MYADLRGNKSFRNKVLSVARLIPKGKVFTYKEVARRAGRPKAYRAVGNILKKNFDPKIPCHRVIRSGGKLGGYNRGADKKRALLEKEGAKIAG
ncbi:MAG: MGMT family protein [Candidatus Liptonbacteria bacterium]|nr:MGMT family protein [Candidatus Liptonbacteria bacterium]